MTLVEKYPEFKECGEYKLDLRPYIKTHEATQIIQQKFVDLMKQIQTDVELIIDKHFVRKEDMKTIKELTEQMSKYHEYSISKQKVKDVIEKVVVALGKSQKKNKLGDKEYIKKQFAILMFLKLIKELELN